MKDISSKSTVNKKKRSFLSLFLGTTIFIYFTSIFGVIMRFLLPKKTKIKQFFPVNLGKLSNIQNNPKYNKKNQSLIFNFNDDPAILIKDNENYKAFSATCTHLGCIIEFKKDKDIFYCNCHGGMYSKSGKNIAGPPPKPIEAYDVLIENEDLIIKKKLDQVNDKKMLK